MTRKEGSTGTTEILGRLKALADPSSLEGMKRFAIATHSALGVRVPDLRKIAAQAGANHALALDLWKTGVHEARLLAAMVDEVSEVTPAQMNAWAADFDSWDVCDVCCCDLFWRTPFAWEKAREWSNDEREYVKRAAFATVAGLAWHDKKTNDAAFSSFLEVIKRESYDERNFVRKAVNWTLRNIGKRNPALNKAAIRAAEEIRAGGSKPGKWIASDALRELRSESVRKRLLKNAAKAT
jgi:3-methyladenine DNA glycosylase AlkD